MNETRPKQCAAHCRKIEAQEDRRLRDALTIISPSDVQRGFVVCCCGRGMILTSEAAMRLDMDRDTEDCPECHALVMTRDAVLSKSKGEEP